MDKLIEENYKSIVDRGLITPSTYYFDFTRKIKEELGELKDAIIDYIDYDSESFPNVKEELADVIMVCLNMAKHYNIEIEQEIKNKIEVNKQRAKNGKGI